MKIKNKTSPPNQYRNYIYSSEWTSARKQSSRPMILSWFWTQIRPVPYQYLKSLHPSRTSSKKLEKCSLLCVTLVLLDPCPADQMNADPGPQHCFITSLIPGANSILHHVQMRFFLLKNPKVKFFDKLPYLLSGLKKAVLTKKIKKTCPLTLIF